MGPDMMEGITRIHTKGNHAAGNFHTQQAKSVRRYYQCKKRSKHMEDQKTQVQRVTGASCRADDVYISALYSCCVIFILLY
jgi:hypothetical protein